MNKKTEKLLGIGNALVDILIPMGDDILLSELGLAKGGMTLIDKKKMGRILQKTRQMTQKRSSGGSAANSVAGLAHLGIQTGFVGIIGNDEFGNFFKSDMKGHAIETHLSIGASETGKSISLISKDTERTMATYLGAASEFHRCNFSDDLFQQYHYLLLEAYLIPNQNLVRGIFQKARKAGMKIALDFSSFTVVAENRDFLDNLVSEYVDIVLANEEEAKQFTGKTEIGDALEYMGKQCKTVIIKRGDKGSLIQQGSRHCVIDPLPVRAIDTTGAGDLYAAGFFYGLIRGYPLEICGKLGAILGGKVVEVLGARMDREKWKEVLELM